MNAPAVQQPQAPAKRPWFALSSLGTRLVIFFVVLLVLVQGLGAFLVIQANSQIARCLIAVAKSRGLKIAGIVRRAELIPEIETLGVDFVGVESPEISSTNSR